MEGLSRGRGERRRSDFLGEGGRFRAEKAKKKYQRERRGRFLREKLERGDLSLRILGSLKKVG